MHSILKKFITTAIAFILGIVLTLIVISIFSNQPIVSIDVSRQRDMVEFHLHISKTLVFGGLGGIAIKEMVKQLKDYSKNK